MLFNSYVFLFAFLPATLAGFFLLGSRQVYRGALAWLVCCSLFFYGWWNPKYLALILASIFVNFSLGILLSRRGSLRGALLLVGVAFNLGLLAYFKYANFFVDSVNHLLGASYHLDTILLPLAISFFTFQQIAYLVDAYRGESEEHSFLHYALFVTFFPQLIAGPIVHHGEMLPQFADRKIFRPDYRNLAVGITIFTFGLFKKVVMADGVALFATPIFGAAEAGVGLSTYEAWCGALAYTLQIYFDFSGYSDMAIGLGRMFGIRLPLNFHSPLKSTNLIEFWRRWHMTLSRFLRDYLYIPLGGNRHGNARRYVNLLTTMVLGGLWHGASWTFVVWGTAHGVGLALNHAWRESLGKSVGAARFWAPPLTFVFIVVTYVVFRAETFGGALDVIGPMFDFTGFATGQPFPNELIERSDCLKTLIVMLGVAWFAPNTQQIMRDFEPAFDTYRGEQRSITFGRIRFSLVRGWAVLVGLAFMWVVASLTRVSEFLYFQF